MTTTRDPDFVSVVVPDTYGVLRGKTLTAGEFARVCGVGTLALPELIHILDPDDVPTIDYPRSRMDGSFGDIVATPHVDRVLPLVWQPGWSICLATPTWTDGTPCGLGSRVVAERVLARAAGQGRTA